MPLPLRTTPHANVLAKCPAVRPFEGKTADDLITDYLELVGMYRECSARHSGLVDSL